MVDINEEDVMGLMDIFTKIPLILLKGAIKGKMNVVESFQDQVESYKSKLTNEEMDKIKAVIEMSVPELQKIIYSTFEKTGKEQLRVLADPNSEEFISINLNELKKNLTE